MAAFLGHASSSTRIRYPWNLFRFHPSMSLIELRRRRNRRSVVGMRSFNDTPQIHLIIPLSVVTNRWTSSVTTGQVSLPYKSTFITHILKTFPDNTCRDYVRTTTTLANQIIKIFEGGFLMKTVIPNVNFLKGCNNSSYDLIGTFTAHKISVVSKAISYSWTLIITQIIWSASDGVSTNTKGTYTARALWTPYWNFVMFFFWDQDFGFVDIYT